MARVREPAVSGLFYPNDPKTLRRMVEEFLDNVHLNYDPGEVIGLISPHAGYVYSGIVAAYGFRSVMGKDYDTVVLIGPSHRSYFRGVSVFMDGYYKTPLGLVEIDESLARRLLEVGRGFVTEDPGPHLHEHSLEVQIPFLQVIFDKIKIVPILMGVQERRTWRELASIFAKLPDDSGKRLLFIASTDLSHYYPYEKAKAIDSVVLRNIEEFNIERTEEDFENERFEACGGGAMIAVMLSAKMLGAKRGIVLKYATSGDTSGDKSSVVGYLSAAFTR